MSDLFDRCEVKTVLWKLRGNGVLELELRSDGNIPRRDLGDS